MQRVSNVIEIGVSDIDERASSHDLDILARSETRSCDKEVGPGEHPGNLESPTIHRPGEYIADTAARNELYSRNVRGLPSSTIDNAASNLSGRHSGEDEINSAN